MKKTGYISIILLIGIISFLFITNISFAQTSDTCHLLTSSNSTPTGYGASYNVLTTAKELLMNVLCQSISATITLGNNSQTQYIYNKGYIYKNNAWQQVSYSCSNLVSSAWCVGNANATINMTTTELSNTNYIVGYICNWTGSAWKCGCRDSSCTTNYWNLQMFKYVAPTPTPNPTPAPSGYTYCAIEDEHCNFSGTRNVKYGANTTFITKTFTNGTSCDNATFGDPLEGFSKYCYYSNTTVSPTPTPTPTPIPTTENCEPAPTSTTIVNVKDRGATGNGSTNDTVAIQAAVDQVAGTGGTVYVPDGTYIIDALASVRLKSDMTFRMSGGAILKAIPNNQEGYAVIYIENASNVNVVGGTVLGDRYEHQGSTGEWGMGIRIGGSTNTAISGVTLKDMWGDGIYINAMSRNTAVCSVVADNNRRQGMSVVHADGVVIRDSVFKNTNGTDPQAGIDLEPNPGTTVSNIQILNSQFLNNYSQGILVMDWIKPNSITNVTIDGNIIEGNNGGIWIYQSDDNRITNNTITDDSAFGIQLDSTGNIVTGNTITVTGGAAGKAIVGSSGNTIGSNTIR